MSNNKVCTKVNHVSMSVSLQLLLSVLDLTLGIQLASAGVSAVVHDGWVFGGFLCGTIAKLSYSCMLCTSYMLTVMVFNMYITIAYPFKHQEILNNHRLAFLVIGSFVVTLFFTKMTDFLNDDIHFVPVLYYCTMTFSDGLDMLKMTILMFGACQAPCLIVQVL